MSDHKDANITLESKSQSITVGKKTVLMPTLSTEKQLKGWLDKINVVFTQLNLMQEVAGNHHTDEAREMFGNIQLAI